MPAAPRQRVSGQGRAGFDVALPPAQRADYRISGSFTGSKSFRATLVCSPASQPIMPGVTTVGMDAAHFYIMQPNVPLPLIFVADDNPTDVFFLRRRLHAAGITNPIHHVEDGMEAVRWFERLLAVQGSLPFLAIIDLKMPRMDGFEVLEWLRTHELTERLTVSVLSTSDEPTDVERALRLGAHKFLVKYPQPVQLIELASLAHRRTVADAPCNEPRLSGDS